MSTVLHPVGPQRARVYWVRRLLAILVVVALAVLATTAVSRLRGGEEPAAAAAAGQSSDQADGAGAAGDEDDAGRDGDAGAGGATTDDDEAEDAPTDAAPTDDDATDDAEAADGDAPAEGEPASSTPVECTPQALQLTLTSSAVEFDAATNPVLTATVTNVGDVACTVDAGDATREVVITSGEDRIWSTKDCASEESASRQLLLGAGAADTAEIEWDRTRSAEGCPGGGAPAKAGTYQAVATLGATTSQTVVFILG